MIRRQKTAAPRNLPLVRFGAGAMATPAEALLPVRIKSGMARNGRIICASDAAGIVRRSPRRRHRLRLFAGRERVDEGALDRAPGRGRTVAAAGGIFGRLVDGAESLDIRLRLGGHPVVLHTWRID